MYLICKMLEKMLKKLEQRVVTVLESVNSNLLWNERRTQCILVVFEELSKH